MLVRCVGVLAAEVVPDLVCQRSGGLFPTHHHNRGVLAVLVAMAARPPDR